MDCNKKSTTFDVFTNIPLSLPEPSHLMLNIIVHRLPKNVKVLLDQQNNISLDEIKRSQSVISKKEKDPQKKENLLQ
jgi:hypothetical protein